MKEIFSGFQKLIWFLFMAFPSFEKKILKVLGPVGTLFIFMYFVSTSIE